MDLFEIEPEKIYGVKTNEPFKKEKIERCVSSNNYVASLKKDGQYYRYVKQDGQVKLQSRGKSVKTGTYCEAQEKVPHIVNFLNSVVPDNSLLVGELYFHNETTNEVGSILRCLPPKAIKRQEDHPLCYYIHDVWAWKGELLLGVSKEKRIEKLYEIKDYFEQNGMETMAPTIEFAQYVNTVEDIRKLIGYAFDNDEEGVVLTKKDSIVNPGLRVAWKTLKIKKELQNDADVFLTGNFKEATVNYDGKEIVDWEYWHNLKTGEKMKGKYYNIFIGGATIAPITKSFYYDYPGSLEMAVIDEDTYQVIPIGWLSGLTEEIKEDFKNNREKYINKVCKVTAMETTNDYKLRHSRFIEFRDDITKEDCTFGKIFHKEEEK